MLKLLCEKLVMADGRPMEFEDIVSNAKARSLENMMGTLKRNCALLYESHKYGIKLPDDKAIWGEAREACREIQQKVWQEKPDLLGIIQAKADCFMGSVYVQSKKYDRALRHLAKAGGWIERNMMQSVIPEFYAEINVAMSKCYMEKKSEPVQINECLKHAEEVLKDQTVKNLVIKHYDKYFYHALMLELNLQWSIIKLDVYGQKQNLDFKLIWEYLKDSDQYYKKLKDAGNNRIGYERWEDWEMVQDATLRTTKGIFYKNLYFRSIKAYDDFKNSDDLSKISDKWDDTIKFMADTLYEVTGCPETDKDMQQNDEKNEKENEKKQQRFSRMKGDLEEIKKLTARSGSSNAQDLQKAAQGLWKVSFEMAFINYAEVANKYAKNTICLGGMAGLAYDCDYSGRRNTLVDWQEILADCCPKYKKGSREESLNGLLDETLKVENINMYTLNIKAALKHGSGGLEKVDSYPALRQSSLKRRLCRMQDKIKDGSGQLGNYMQEIALNIISLYREVTNFMNAAIVNCNSNEWKGLEIGHYTKLEVVPKLINKEGDSRLRLHNAHHMNDNREGVLLINHLNRILKGAGTSLIGKIMDKYTDEMAGAVRSYVYIGSFTSRVDVMNMWNRYGDEGRGVCLQFDAAKFFDSEAKYSLADISTADGAGSYKMEDIKYPLYMVVYLPDNDIDVSESQYAKGYAEAKGGTEKQYAEECAEAGKIDPPIKTLEELEQWFRNEHTEAEKEKLLDRADIELLEEWICAKKRTEDEKNKLLDQVGIELLEARVYAKGRAEAEKENPLEKKWWEKQAALIKELLYLERNIKKYLKNIQYNYEKLYQKGKEKMSGDWDSFEKELISCIMVIIDLIRFLIKRDHFRNEREYRIIQYSSDPQYEQGDAGIPRLFVPVEKEPSYNKICFGSQVMDFDSKAAYILNIRKDDKNGGERSTWDIEVCKSNVPIRVI